MGGESAFFWEVGFIKRSRMGSGYMGGGVPQPCCLRQAFKKKSHGAFQGQQDKEVEWLLGALLGCLLWSKDTALPQLVGDAGYQSGVCGERGKNAHLPTTPKNIPARC